MMRPIHSIHYSIAFSFKFLERNFKNYYSYIIRGDCHVQLKETEIYRFRKKGKSHELF